MKLFLSICMLWAVLWIWNIGYSQDISTGNLQACDINSYQIITNSTQKIWIPYQGQLVQRNDDTSTGSALMDKTINRSVSSYQGIIAKGTWNIAQFTPKIAWTHQLTYLITYDQCEVSVSINISAYEYLFVMISDREDGWPIIHQHPTIWLIRYTPTERNRVYAIQSWYKPYDWFLIQMTNIIQAFEIIQRNVSTQSRKVILESDLDPRLIKRYVAQQSQWLSGSTIYIMNNEQLSTALLRLWLWQYDIMTGIQLYPSDMSQDDVSWGQFLDQLLLYGFPIELLIFALVSCVAIMILVIIKHVVGFSIYQLAYPLIIGQIMAILWRWTTSVVIIATLLSCRIVAIWLRRLPVLYSTKIWLVMMGSFVGAGVIVLLMQFFMPEYRSYGHLHQPLTIVSISLISRAIYRLFYDKIWLSWFTQDLVRFAAICTMMWGLYSFEWLQSLLLRFPVLIIWVMIITISAWRYRGLQVREYLRFWPLIKHQLFKNHPKN